MNIPLLLRGALLCGLLCGGCQRDIRKLHIEKRIYRPGWYISIPPKGEPITHQYPPPAQTPVVYPSSVPKAPPAGGQAPLPPSGKTGSPPVAGGPAQTPVGGGNAQSPVAGGGTQAPAVGGTAQTPSGGTTASGGTPVPPMPDSLAPPPVAQQPAADTTADSGNPVATPELALDAGVRVFAAGLMPSGRNQFPVAAGAGFAGAGFSLKTAIGNRFSLLFSCSYKYTFMRVRQSALRPLPLAAVPASHEKIRLHGIYNEAAFGVELSPQAFIHRIHFALGIERIVHSALIAKTGTPDTQPQSGQQSHTLTRTKVTGLYGIRPSAWYVGAGVTHNFCQLFAQWRITPQTRHETDFQPFALGVMLAVGH